MNQRTETSWLGTEVRFLVCKNCGLHGCIIIPPGVGQRQAGQPEALSQQPEVRSQEAAVLQVVGLAVEGFINVAQVKTLIGQIIESDLSPMEADIETWAVTMGLERMMRDVDDPQSELGQAVSTLEALLTGGLIDRRRR